MWSGSIRHAQITWQVMIFLFILKKISKTRLWREWHDCCQNKALWFVHKSTCCYSFCAVFSINRWTFICLLFNTRTSTHYSRGTLYKIRDKWFYACQKKNPKLQSLYVQSTEYLHKFSFAPTHCHMRFKQLFNSQLSHLCCNLYLHLRGTMPELDSQLSSCPAKIRQLFF